MNSNLASRWLLPPLFALALTASAADPPPGLPGQPVGPLAPREEQGTFRLLPGFRIDLVAAEPDVVDPVAMAFDARGRIFVCEMRGYPNAGVGTGAETRGRVRRLSDSDGDGVFETATIYAEGLRFPMGITPFKNGMIVAVAPDIIYLEDADDDGRADKKTVLYTGFNLANIQQMVNSLQWAADGWIHGLAGNNAGTIQSAEKPDAPPVTLQARGFRFRPEIPGSLEPTSGGGQYGLAPDDFGHWFTATNSQHLRQIVIPDHYLRRNPAALVTAVTLDIPDHGAACKVFRISPFEGWRVERTTRRAGSADARRFPATELIPGGFATSACSPVIYTATLFPPEFRGNSFVCDPANNLIHRDVLQTKGAVFNAKRGDADCEFLASTDNWFRPVHLTLGPDGALYVLDFYREVIETPLSLPDDIKAKLNLESRDRGRIWRIAPKSSAPGRLPDLAKDGPTKLVERLSDSTSWVRLTAHRLLCEGNHGDAVKATSLRDAAGKPHLPVLLGVLDRFELLTDESIAAAFADPLPGNREVALRHAEARFASMPRLRAAARKLTEDPDSMVRFQVALSAGSFPPAEAGPVLAALIRVDGEDPWMGSAILCSSREAAIELIESVLLIERAVARMEPLRGFVTRAANAVGARGNDAELTKLVALVAEGKGSGAGLDLALIEGLGQGMRGKKVGLAAWLAKPPAAGRAAATKLQKRFTVSASVLTENPGPIALAERIDIVRFLAFAPFEIANPPLRAALAPEGPPELQLAAVRSLSAQSSPKVPELLLVNWANFGPSVRREILERLLSSPARIPAVLDAVEKGTIKPVEIDPVRIAQLKTHANAALRARSVKVFAGQVNVDRRKLIEDYQSALELTGSAEKGHAVFKQHCAACHKLGADGHEVGPNLLATIPGKSGEDLLISLLDPNREVDPRYLSYVANTADGQVLTGIVTAETAAAVSLRRSDGAEDTIRRGDLDSLKSSGLSLMPDGMEKNLSKQDVADLLAYLRQAVGAAAPKK